MINPAILIQRPTKWRVYGVGLPPPANDNSILINNMGLTINNASVRIKP